MQAYALPLELLKSDPFADGDADERQDDISAGTDKSCRNVISAKLSFGD